MQKFSLRSILRCFLKSFRENRFLYLQERMEHPVFDTLVLSIVLLQFSAFSSDKDTLNHVGA